MRRKPQAEVRFLVDRALLDRLQKKLQRPKATDIVRSALTLLDWVTEEVAQKRVIQSSTREGKDIHRLVMPDLQTVEAREKKG